jgi:hypothetical protein
MADNSGLFCMTLHRETKALSGSMFNKNIPARNDVPRI